MSGGVRGSLRRNSKALPYYRVLPYTTYQDRHAIPTHAPTPLWRDASSERPRRAASKNSWDLTAGPGTWEYVVSGTAVPPPIRSEGRQLVRCRP
jgi:hypothetical protein